MTAYVPPATAEWLEGHTGAPRRWADASHAVEWALAFLMQQEQRFGSLNAFELAVAGLPAPAGKDAGPSQRQR